MNSAELDGAELDGVELPGPEGVLVMRGSLGRVAGWALGTMGHVSISPVELDEPQLGETTANARPWVTLVWNDPINLMSYVSYVFQAHFGYSRAKSDKLMMQVHEEGRSAVSTGTREAMERDVQAMHEYGLWATMRKDD